jgi:hypothetical protein
VSIDVKRMVTNGEHERAGVHSVVANLKVSFRHSVDVLRKTTTTSGRLSVWKSEAVRLGPACCVHDL